MTWFSLGEGNRLSVRGPAEPGRPARDGRRPTSPGARRPRVTSSTRASASWSHDWDGTTTRGQNVRGKIVLVLDGEPGAEDPASPFDGVVTSEAGRSWRKARAPRNRVRPACSSSAGTPDATQPDRGRDLNAGAWPDQPRRIERFLLSDWVEDLTIPAAEISAELAEALVKGDGRPMAELAEDAESAEHGFGVIALKGAQVTLTTAVVRHSTQGRNVLAMIEGSDPALRDQVVIVSGHFDHNGADSADVYNGADDNASGAVGVLAVAEAYARAAQRGDRPRRTVLFAAWDAEERLMLGSWFYTRRPLFPMQSTVAVLNMDMIGRNEEVPADGGGRFRGLEPQAAETNANAVNILGYSRTPELVADVQAANEPFGLTLRLRYDNNESQLLRRSDHWPFLNEGVPAVWFHTGLHPDYHTPNDDADRLNYEKMTRIVKLVHATSWAWPTPTGGPRMGPMGTHPRS